MIRMQQQNSMIRPSTFIFLIGCIYLSQYSVQATVFSCNRTAPCGCSRFNADINARIVGGELAATHSWGWAVVLRDYFDGYMCGAAVISSSYIITAAHCVENIQSRPDLLSIRVGSDTLSMEGQAINVSRIYVHPDYTKASHQNDIAILYLARPIDFRDVNVGKICLPDVLKAEQTRYPIVKKPVVAIGWGSIYSGGSMTSFLRQVTVKTVEQKDKTCKNVIKNAEVQFCAAVNGGGKDTCQGDSGGPLMYYSENDQAWVLAGITSYGRGCALPGYAGVYTRVSVYMNWIRSVVGNDGVVAIRQNKATIGTMSSWIIFALISYLTVARIYH